MSWTKSRLTIIHSSTFDPSRNTIFIISRNIEHPVVLRLCLIVILSYPNLGTSFGSSPLTYSYTLYRTLIEPTISRLLPAVRSFTFLIRGRNITVKYFFDVFYILVPVQLERRNVTRFIHTSPLQEGGACSTFLDWLRYSIYSNCTSSLPLL